MLVCEINKAMLVSRNAGRNSDDTMAGPCGNDVERLVYLCSECGAASETSAGIVDHLTTVHKDQETIRTLLRIREQRLQRAKTKKVLVRVIHRCELCNYKTWYRTTFERHKMKHKQVRQYECPICPYKSMQASNVRRHVLHRHPKATEQVVGKISLSANEEAP